MSKATDEKEILITVESDGMVRLERDMVDDGGEWVKENGYYPCDDRIQTQAIRQLFARLSAKEREVERLPAMRVALRRLIVQAQMTDDFTDSIGGTLRRAVEIAEQALREDV